MPTPQQLSGAPLALTMGDPAGIGLDISLMAWRRRSEAIGAFVFYGDAGALQARGGAIGLDVPIARIERPAEAVGVFARAIPVVDIPAPVEISPGSPSRAAAPAVIAAIDRATAAVVAGEAVALVTNPIAKSVLYEAGFTYPGHTEYLAALADRHVPRPQPYLPVMMLVSDELKVVPLTIHVPLADVPGLVTGALIEQTVRIVHRSMREEFGIAQPRIVVAGLNPHAGEDGTMGREDLEIIAPALARLAQAGIATSGPLSADTLFHAAARATYDVAICMFHDQALIPIKTLAFDQGVNTTLGLPFVRTSPDHGTAFSLAGTGKARPDSLIAALALARRMGETRRART